MESKKLITTLAFFASATLAWGAPDFAKILFTEGNVSVDGKPVTQTAPKINLGSTIETDNGHATVLFGKNHVMDLDTSTRIRFTSDTQNSRAGSAFAIGVSLERGQIRGSRAANQQLFGDFRVKTPSGSVALREGRYLLGLAKDGKVNLLTLDSAAKIIPEKNNFPSAGERGLASQEDNGPKSNLSDYREKYLSNLSAPQDPMGPKSDTNTATFSSVDVPDTHLADTKKEISGGEGEVTVPPNTATTADGNGNQPTVSQKRLDDSTAQNAFATNSPENGAGGSTGNSLGTGPKFPGNSGPTTGGGIPGMDPVQQPKNANVSVTINY